MNSTWSNYYWFYGPHYKWLRLDGGGWTFCQAETKTSIPLDWEMYVLFQIEQLTNEK